MIYLQPLSENKNKFSCIIGTGGIGSGIFFRLEDNHTLGRNESRMGKLLQSKDYCKLHIITHYIAILLGAGLDSRFKVFPIGKVGNDHTGIMLFDEIKAVGMDTKYIEIVPGCSTLFSVCYQYPDKTGGNITTTESASSRVTPEDISRFFSEHNSCGSDELVLAAPEVPLNTRIRLLECGKQRNSFNIASVLSSEINEFNSLKGFEMVDLLSINIDEARSIAQIHDESISTEIVVEKCVDFLTHANPSMSILITNGPEGSYSYSDNYLEHTPILDVDVAATAGAGDTFLAGTIAGLCCKLPLSKGRNDKVFSETPLSSSVELGSLLASLAVTSPHTIFPEANTMLLYKFAQEKGVRFSPDFSKLFESCT